MILNMGINEVRKELIPPSVGDKDDDDDHFEDPPPPYDDIGIGSSSPEAHSATLNRNAPTKKGGPEFYPPNRPLKFFPPHPNHVKCCCGRYVDTRKPSIHLPLGQVFCECGYVVTSAGYSYFPVQGGESATDKTLKCDACATPIPSFWKLREFVCRCGARFQDGEHVKRWCPYHKVESRDARNMRCFCGLYVDTTAEWKVRHGHLPPDKHTEKQRSCKGYSTYEYTLPRGSGKCKCGATVTRDGNLLLDHRRGCCRTLSHEKKEPVVGTEDSCTCAYLVGTTAIDLTS